MTTCRQSLHPEKGRKSGRLQDFSAPISEESPAPGAVPARGPGEQTQVKVTCAAGRGPSLSRWPGQGLKMDWTAWDVAAGCTGDCTQAEAWPFYLRLCGGRARACWQHPQLQGSLLLPRTPQGTSLGGDVSRQATSPAPSRGSSICPQFQDRPALRSAWHGVTDSQFDSAGRKRQRGVGQENPHKVGTR